MVLWLLFAEVGITMKKNVFIGLAWPYANGSLHLGHVSAFIGADILARFHRLYGNKVLFVSGSDCYGTPIAVEATQRGIEPSEIAERYHAEFQETLCNGLGFSYDLYTKTTTDQHASVVQELFLKLYENGNLYLKTQDALYSPFLNRFLPDRFVEGTCPKCKAIDARGDQCDECGSLLDSLELINPRINPRIITRETALSADNLHLERRPSEHFYLKLTGLQQTLEKWVAETSGPWRANAKGFAESFLRQGLHDRAITRDTDWGIPIPLPGYDNKRIYVWFEAVTGYLSASKLWAKNAGTPEAWKDFWLNDDALHYYVHGKDNIPFHTIIWPALLFAEGTLHKPDRIISSEYLTLEGKQFSKSRGWAVWLPDFLEAFEADTLRYFLVVCGPESRDADFSWSEYSEKINGELIGTFGNLVNRTLTFAEKHFPEGMTYPEIADAESRKLIERTEKAFEMIGVLITNGQFRAAFKEILDIAQTANQYVHLREPWHKIKDVGNREEVESTLAILSHVIRNLAVLINPFLPKTSSTLLGFYNSPETELSWKYRAPLSSERIKVSSVRSLYRKITPEEVEFELSKLGNNTALQAGTERLG